MKIRCKDSKNSKLVEGQIYDAEFILGNIEKFKAATGSKYYGGRRVELYNGDSYSGVDRFETLDGKTLYDIYIDERPDEEDLTKLLICKKNISFKELKQTWIKYTGSNSSKYFVDGNYYKVQTVNDKNYYSDVDDFRVIIKGFEHWTSTRSFRLLKKDELRNLKIDMIDGEEVVTTNYTRKFDAINSDEKFKVLMNLLLRAREEFSKNNFKDLSIEEYIVETDNKYGITKDDIEEFKQIKITELF